MAQVDIGKIKIVWKGPWNSGTAYTVDDAVSHSGSSYICIQAGTNQNPSSATAYWQVMATAGTDGTDVGATLNNNEIAFKTNAGAVDGIPIGTAGQYLKVNSGANGYEYGSITVPTSDYVRLSTTNISNGVGTINIDNVFTSDYNTYKIFMTGIKGHDSTNGMVQLKFRNGNSSVSGSYWVAGKGSYRTSSANNNATDGEWGYGSIPFGGWNTPDTDTESGNATYDYDMTVFGINGSNYKKLLYKMFGWEQGNSYVIFSTGGGLVNNTGTVNGIQVARTNGGGFSSDGKIIIYGLKH